MQLKHILMILVINFSFVGLTYGQYNMPSDSGFYGSDGIGQEPCKCYCSDKCGPRNMKPDDTPFIDGGICFCKERDRVNFTLKGCDRKPYIDFQSCCDI